MIAREIALVSPIALDVYHGLMNRPRSLPPKLFYDSHGSALFEQITALPEYYLTRTESEILNERAAEIVSCAGKNLTIVELGAGTAAKTLTLLQALQRRQLRVEYFPVDISAAALDEARQRINGSCPGLKVHPVVADFSDGFSFLRDIPRQKLVLFLGSSIGNFDRDAATAILHRVREELAEHDALLVGTDLAKAPSILLPAYDDNRGVTSDFNKNVLRRINRELAGTFDVDSFRHVAEWNSAASRMEMYLESMRPQQVRIAALGMTLRFDCRERIHTENSYKYSIPMVTGILNEAGFTLERSWFDSRHWYALNLARVRARHNV